MKIFQKISKKIIDFYYLHSKYLLLWTRNFKEESRDREGRNWDLKACQVGAYNLLVHTNYGNHFIFDLYDHTKDVKVRFNND